MRTVPPASTNNHSHCVPVSRPTSACLRWTYISPHCQEHTEMISYLHISEIEMFRYGQGRTRQHPIGTLALLLIIGGAYV